MNQLHPVHTLTAVLAAVACVLAALALYYSAQARSAAELAGIIAGSEPPGVSYSDLQEVRQDIQQLRQELIAAGVIPEPEPGPGEPTPIPENGAD